MKGLNLVILAGGVSSRMKKSIANSADTALRAAAHHKAKSMIGIGDGKRPLLDYLLWNAETAGYRDIVLVVGEDSSPFQEHYGKEDRNNAYHSLLISYAVQEIPEGRTKPLGTADALLRALRLRSDWAGDAFTVCNGDNLYSEQALRQMLEAGTQCAATGYDQRGLRFAPDRIRQFGVFKTDSGGRLVDIIEKPDAAQFAGAAAAQGRIDVSMNLFRFAYDEILPFLECVPLNPDRLEKELPTAVLMMVRAHPGSLKVFPVAEHVPDLTSVHDIAAVDEYLANHYHGRLWR